MNFGPVRRWKEGEVFFAENDFIKMAYAVTDDAAQVGEIGIVADTFVEWITAEQAKAWEQNHGP